MCKAYRRNQADFERVSISCGEIKRATAMFELGTGEEKKILNNSGRQRLLREVSVQGDNFRYTRCFVKDTLCLPVHDRLSSLLKLFLSNSAHCLRRPRPSRLAPHLRLNRVNTDGRGEESAPCHSPQLTRQCGNSQMQHVEILHFESTIFA